SLPANGSAWIGLTDQGRAGNWTWMTGEPFAYSNWAAGEPNNPGTEDWVGYTNGESPAWSWNNFEMNDYGSGALYGFIVEFNPASIVETTMSVSSSALSAPTSQSITLTATVNNISAGGPTPDGGTVTFSDQSGTIGSAKLVDGVAMFKSSSLAV